jgi:hypothetical protein
MFLSYPVLNPLPKTRAAQRREPEFVQSTSAGFGNECLSQVTQGGSSPGLLQVVAATTCTPEEIVFVLAAAGDPSCDDRMDSLDGTNALRPRWPVGGLAMFLEPRGSAFQAFAPDYWWSPLWATT